ncbi:MAG: hypothetical protein NC210_09860 [[Clostridium] fimetarium]|nr:hypothetical protein [[Clostridium] fimetarium]
MKQLLLMLAAGAACVAATAQDQVPAFPGAEGHGRYTQGGRGGSVKIVTNLNDSGSGSLRAAVSGDTKKIVVFNVAGEINLKSDLVIGANTTIAGQTAPAPGITLRHYTVLPNANNVVIRFIRVRRGQEVDVNDGADAIWTRNHTGIILDHCSLSWSIDEVASFYDNNNFTMQWCNVTESLCNSGHEKGEHGYGGIWGGKLASFHHNLIAHVKNRGPRFNGARYEWSGWSRNTRAEELGWKNHVQAENVDFRNCVQYNAAGSCYGGPGGGQINIVNNYYKQGPSGQGGYNRVTTASVASSGNSSKHDNIFGMASRYYISGNTAATRLGEETPNRDWAGVTYDSGVKNIDGVRWTLDNNNYYGDAVEHRDLDGDGKQWVSMKLDEPAPTGEVTTHSAGEAYGKVLDFAGASLFRDACDTRYAEEARTGTAVYTGSKTRKPGLIDVVSDIDYQPIETVRRPDDWDTDRDGMPDHWEIANGLDPNSPSDARATTLDPRGWYTNIEVYANSLVEHIVKAQNADALESVDEYFPACVSAIETVSADRGSEVTAIEYYTPEGRRIPRPAPGISIRRLVFADGHTETDKVMSRD